MPGLNINQIVGYIRARRAARARQRRIRFRSYIRHRNRLLQQYVIQMLMIVCAYQAPGVRSIWKRFRSGSFWEDEAIFMHDQQFQANFRISHETFDFLLSRISWRISKRNTNMRKSIPADKRLAVTLYLLGDGSSLRSVANIFGISEQSVSNIIRNVTGAIIAELAKEFIAIPSGQHLIDVMNGFQALSGLPNCVGAVDGSHISIKAPTQNPIDYYNRKQDYSIVLQGVCDHLGR